MRPSMQALLNENAELKKKIAELREQKPEWIVNDEGELGVEINGKCFFLYKGYSLVYEEGKHDDGTPMMYRPVAKREFGETQWPQSWVVRGFRDHRYTVTGEFIEGLSDGTPSDWRWRPLPVVTSNEGEEACSG